MQSYYDVTYYFFMPSPTLVVLQIDTFLHIYIDTFTFLIVTGLNAMDAYKDSLKSALHIS